MNSFDGTRWCFIDGARGIAALAVVCRHLVYNSPLAETLQSTLPMPVLLFCTHGGYGVEVFFVISGLVIALSLRNSPVTAPEVGGFIFRRQLRLDPPYWAMIAFLLALEMGRNLVGRTPMPMSSFGEILANLFYLHRIGEFKNMLIVSWTLCLEVQFYLFFILLLVSARVLRGGRRCVPLEAAMILITGLISLGLACRVHPHSNIATTWFLFPWFYFAGGVLCYHSVRDRKYDAIFAIFVAGFVAAFSLGNRWEPNIVAGFLTILIFWVVGKAGKLTTWLRQEVFQYFGRISYSLYLVHFPISMIFLRAAHELTGENKAMAVVWFSMALGFSIVVAHFFHQWVEVPSMRLVTSFKRAPGETRAVPDHDPETVKPSSLMPVMASRMGGVDPA